MSNLYKDPIKVICRKNGSTKLIKGATYEVSSLYTGRYSNFTKTAYIVNVGSYNADYFVLENNQPLSSMQDFSLINSDNIVDTKNVNYTGQFVKCRYSSSKTLKANEIYYVEEHKKVEKYGYNKQIYYEDKFKIRGIKNLVNSYCFTQIPIIEQRNIKLKNLTGEKIKTGEQTRKFLLYSEKERNTILLDVFSRTLIDISKIHSTINLDIEKEIPKLMMKKGSKYALTIDDITPFLEFNIKNIINLICK